MPAGILGAAHRVRLRAIWRSAGWPCHDAIELDLLAAGHLSRHWDEVGRETLRVSDSGLDWLAAGRRRHQAALNAHEALVARVAQSMQREGRLVWCGLALRAPLPGDDGKTLWPIAMPDVFSIRHTTREDATAPRIHEIKVSRADLLSDLRHPTKTAAYLALCSECWYVIARGIAEPDELPPTVGVIVAADDALETARPAPHRAQRLSFPLWMALARSTMLAAEDDAQRCLGEPGDDPS